MAIKFFNIRSGEEVTAVTEPMISAFYNSGDLHVNARLGQDFGWRIAPETLSRMQTIQSDQNLMDRIAMKFLIPLGEVADVDVMRWISIEDEEAKAKEIKKDEVDHEAEYQRQIRKLTKVENNKEK